MDSSSYIDSPVPHRSRSFYQSKMPPLDELDSSSDEDLSQTLQPPPRPPTQPPTQPPTLRREQQSLDSSSDEDLSQPLQPPPRPSTLRREQQSSSGRKKSISLKNKPIRAPLPFALNGDHALSESLSQRYIEGTIFDTCQNKKIVVNWEAVTYDSAGSLVSEPLAEDLQGCRKTCYPYTTKDSYRVGQEQFEQFKTLHEKAHPPKKRKRNQRNSDGSSRNTRSISNRSGARNPINLTRNGGTNRGVNGNLHQLENENADIENRYLRRQLLVHERMHNHTSQSPLDVRRFRQRSHNSYVRGDNRRNQNREENGDPNGDPSYDQDIGVLDTLTTEVVHTEQVRDSDTGFLQDNETSEFHYNFRNMNFDEEFPDTMDQIDRGGDGGIPLDEEVDGLVDNPRVVNANGGGLEFDWEELPPDTDGLRQKRNMAPEHASLREGIPEYTWDSSLQSWFNISGFDEDYFEALCSEWSDYAHSVMNDTRTNRFANSRFEHNFSVEEVVIFHGILMKMSNDGRSVGGYEQYFVEGSTSVSIGGGAGNSYTAYEHFPWAKEMMSLNRFKQCMAAYRSQADRVNTGIDKAAQLRRPLEAINRAAKKTFRPGRQVSFDEGGVASRSRLNPIRQYNKDKPKKFRVDFFILSDAKQYFIYHIDVYQGK